MRTDRLPIFLLLALLLPACASQQTLRPFVSDGCSLFPDKALIGDANWCDCCLVHDLAYWKGGTAEQRQLADQQLHDCVLARTGNAALAKAMLAGVKAGGTPHLPTSFRWAYGWPRQRNYEPLRPAEAVEAQQLEQQYRTQHPGYQCGN
ncbi:MAG TPA: hypothetical protein VLI06_05785 [Solimonas sp.]|nr:hypothetical protein [Solimonas sp.]